MAGADLNPFRYRVAVRSRIAMILARVIQAFGHDGSAWYDIYYY